MKASSTLLGWEDLAQLVAAHAESPMGRELAGRMRPFESLDRLHEAWQAVRESEVLLEDCALTPLHEATDLRPLLAAAHRRGSGLEGEELRQVLATLRVATDLRGRLAPRTDRPRLQERARRLPELGELLERLATSIEPNGEVADSASPRLADVRRQRAGLEREVRILADRIAGRAVLRAVLRGGPPVLRDGRLMLAVRAESRGNVRGLLHDRSTSGATVFVEPEELVEPQNRLFDLRRRERQIVSRVLLELTRDVLRHEGEIDETLRLLASLDVVFARARYGLQVGGTLVEVRARGPLELRRAYHPLLLERERAAAGDVAARNRVVPFDLTLGEDFRGLLITGPNTGGKTVTLKTIGLVALMAHAAVPAPVAAGSVVPWLDGVHADIGDEQDLQQNLSTFSGHLERIATILGRVTPRSLVLFDELGSGTDPQEGEALSDALLRHLLRQGCLLVATTHLSGLKALGFELDGLENASLEFDAESLRPLFRLTLGLPGESNALRIARRHGIPPEVVAGAEQRLERGLPGEARQAREDALRSRQAALDHLTRAERERQVIDARSAELEGRIRELEERGRVLEFQKEHEIDRLLQRIADEGRAALADVGQPPAALAPRLERVRRFLDGLPSHSSLGRRLEAFARSRRPDDLVYLPRYREECRVRKVDRARGTITVLYRSMPLELPFKELACPDDFEP